MKEENIAETDILEPPGGILIWILIFLELSTFGLALVFMASESRTEAELFHFSRLKLNTALGLVNTLILLSSGYFMASSLRHYKNDEMAGSARRLRLAMLLGWIFILIKGWEFVSKIDEDLSISSNTFFAYYWLLAGFHFIHVLIGLIILLLLNRNAFKAKTAQNLEYFDAGATFWHMCDLIWLIIFPMLYLFY